ncbi:peptide chain release factor N(5)-glutamine methyltransferase [Aliterella atlantica]|uniref:peptide chain release factor N(5)-glutamine methyltransferase n=1 Tax=Aliterella atlantica TaxID=1827278 RepID=UPI0005D4012E|nr:peptide chain release factor N(5)-glutamine methyltransferase [Aliterella atlantica]
MTQRQRLISGQELWQWRKIAQQQALAANVSVMEVDWLLSAIAPLERLALKLESFKDLPQIQLQLDIDELDRLWQQRLYNRLPIQYIAGVAPWRHFKIAVSPAVLIPRPETEQLIDLAVAAAKSSPLPVEQGQWVDLGTGSGAIALGLAEAFPQAQIHAVDRSNEAIAIAKKNAENLGFSDRISFYQGNWWEPLAFLKGKLSGMVSNPPYIPSALVPQLQPEVANHEPRLALDGGEDGLDCIRHLVTTAPDYLQTGGIWLVEMMAGQAEAVIELLKEQGSYTNIQIHTDFAGIERFAQAQRNSDQVKENEENTFV